MIDAKTRDYVTEISEAGKAVMTEQHAVTQTQG